MAQHFDAPDDFTGHFGWLCGYSADAPFLDEATERFSRLTRSQRGHEGRIFLAVVLDPHNPPVSLTDVPGVAHLRMIKDANKPFRLLHAKVALLGFRHQENPANWQLRLLVSTGNWTRQTLEESIDMGWRIDITSESLSNPDADIDQACTDIKAAWDLLKWIQRFFDFQLLNAAGNGYINETKKSLQQVNQWIDACSKKAQSRPRFLDNRSKSLLSQLPEKVKACCEVKRNYLAMGSGFYEESADQGTAPKLPVAIVRSLQSEGLLTKNPEVDLYVNPIACQAIATSVNSLQSFGITIRPAFIPLVVFGEGAQRSLHAKFLFSANHRDSSNICASAWIYMGSANLTKPGFDNPMSADAGNLEAGVVFAPSTLYWSKDKTTQSVLVVTNLLPIQWDEEIGDTSHLSAGSGIEQRDEIYLAPPIAFLTWHDSVPELRTDEPADYVDVLDSAGVVCSRRESGFQWCEAQPRQVRIRWQANDQTLESMIPIVDQYGRIAATELPFIDIDQAWWQLADFPMPPNEDDGDGGSDEIEGKHKVQGRSAEITNYPIRQMMELIENIAAKQTKIDKLDLDFWCNRLEQTLGQTAESIPV